ncbi:MAG: M48 family metalloprotease [Acidobacteria bacterium]|nr:M48 family metalloprotease [Acidobacteriota bacterium]
MFSEPKSAFPEISPGQLDMGVVFDYEQAPVEIPPPSTGAVSFYRSGNVLWGIHQSLGVLVAPFLVIAMVVIPVWIDPLFNDFTRYQEREADRFGLEMTRDNRAAATAFTNLIQENIDYPRPGVLYMIWRATHPSTSERIDFCNTYHPWRDGQPLKYSGLFRDEQPEFDKASPTDLP